jgi:hypothetical protein
MDHSKDIVGFAIHRSWLAIPAKQLWLCRGPTKISAIDVLVNVTDPRI